MTSTPVYVPSTDSSNIESSVYVRQNAWKKIEDILETIEQSKKIHLPHAHTKGDIELYNESKKINHMFAKNIANLPIGTIVLIPNKKNGLLVRLTSEVKSGILDNLCITVKSKVCGHEYTRSTNDCKNCSDAIESIFNPLEVNRIQSFLKKGNSIEPFFTLYRDCDIIGKADYNGIDGRSLAGMDSVGNWSRYWKLKET